MIVSINSCHRKVLNEDRSLKKDIAAVSVENAPDSVVVLLDFKTDIRPILHSHCMPCHFPGGKMYSKMPFDSAQTIVDHAEGVLRRIKDPAENEKIKIFISQAQLAVDHYE
ncbi:MAG: hypothetical protein ACOYXT_29770 [Bacteroidota bacterium]